MKVGEKIPDIEFEAYHEGEIKKMRLSNFRGKAYQRGQLSLLTLMEL